MLALRWLFSLPYLQKPKYQLSLNNQLTGIKVYEASSFIAKAFGLLPVKTLEKEQALMLIGCSSVHTYMMAFPIAVIYLDEYNQIIQFEPRLLPNRISKGCKGAVKVIEIEPNLIKKLGIQLDLRLDFVSI